MNIIGEYSVCYKIYTMFDVFDVKITNHNLITTLGYDFFMSKWYKDEILPYRLGYYVDGKFYEEIGIDDVPKYEYDYSTQLKYIDKLTYREYRYDGEKLVEFTEKLEKICLGNISYLNDEVSIPSKNDDELYNSLQEYIADDIIIKENELIMKCELIVNELNNTTEIGVKTNHGRLVSHDIHPPYNLPFGTAFTLEYVFKLGKGE